MIEIIAIFASPIVAFIVGNAVTNRKELMRRRHALFQSLWLTRADQGSFGRLSAEHVRALNMIEIEFRATSLDNIIGTDFVPVIEAWRRYLGALMNTPEEVLRNVGSEAARTFYFARNLVFLELVFEISNVLRYGFSREDIAFAQYAPQAYLDNDGDAMALRKAARGVLEGRTPLRVVSRLPRGAVYGARTDLRPPRKPKSTK